MEERGPLGEAMSAARGWRPLPGQGTSAIRERRGGQAASHRVRVRYLQAGKGMGSPHHGSWSCPLSLPLRKAMLGCCGPNLLPPAVLGCLPDRRAGWELKLAKTLGETETNPPPPSRVKETVEGEGPLGWERGLERRMQKKQGARKRGKPSTKSKQRDRERQKEKKRQSQRHRGQKRAT